MMKKIVIIVYNLEYLKQTYPDKSKTDYKNRGDRVI